MKKALTLLIVAAGALFVFSKFFLVHYYVRFGDTLIEIAESFGVSPSTILDWNEGVDPRHLKTGQELLIPIPDGIIYEVKKGDTLDTIAKRFFTVVDVIKEANDLVGEIIFPGQKLFIPMETVGIAFNDTRTLIWPAYGEISSPFGWRIHPITKRWSFHTGIDIAAPQGTPIFAADNGVVEYAGRKKGYGLFVILNHGVYKTAYGHLSRIDVFVGQYVRRGELIGRVGSTGVSTGPHLHFEVRYRNKCTNPLSFLPSPGRKYVLGVSQKWMGGK